MQIDPHRLREVLSDVVAPAIDLKSEQIDLDTLEETLDYAVSEIADSGIELPAAAETSDESEERDRLHLTLNQVEAHPLNSVFNEPILQSLLGIPAPQATLLTGDILEAYHDWRPASSLSDLGPDVDQKKGALGECRLCERHMPLTAHHLIPRVAHADHAARGLQTITWLRSRANIALLCRQCHSAVHRQLTHEQLAREFDTLDKLLTHPGVLKWAAYASKLKERSAAYPGLQLKNKR